MIVEEPSGIVCGCDSAKHMTVGSLGALVCKEPEVRETDGLVCSGKLCVY